MPTALPEFDGAEHSVLADRHRGAVDQLPRPRSRRRRRRHGFEPAWRERWEDPQRLPQLIRIDVRPERGAPWPTLSRRRARRPRPACRALGQRRARGARRDDARMRLNARPRNAGIALVLTLWLTVLLTAIAGGFAYSMHIEAVAAGNAVSVAQVRAAADGAIERTVTSSRGRASPARGCPTARRTRGRTARSTIVVRATDETAKIDLNGANEVLLRGLFTQIGGVDADTAATARRRDDRLARSRRLPPPERRRGAPTTARPARRCCPPNAPFETVGEVVARARHDARDLRAHRRRASPCIRARPASTRSPRRATCCSRCPTPTPAVVDAYIARRDEALATKLPPPPFRRRRPDSPPARSRRGGFARKRRCPMV